MKYIQDILQIEVNRIRKELGFHNLTFYYSTLNEFIDHLIKLGSQSERYPFFFVNSNRVSYNFENNDCICSVENIIIATLSDPKWTASRRDNESFKPYISPIYDMFELGMRKNREISIHSYGELKIHYFYGNEGIVGYEGLVFPDFIDAMQLKDYKFRISQNNNK